MLLITFSIEPLLLRPEINKSLINTIHVVSRSTSDCKLSVCKLRNSFYVKLSTPAFPSLNIEVKCAWYAFRSPSFAIRLCVIFYESAHISFNPFRGSRTWEVALPVISPSSRVACPGRRQHGGKNCLDAHECTRHEHCSSAYGSTRSTWRVADLTASH